MAKNKTDLYVELYAILQDNDKSIDDLLKYMCDCYGSYMLEELLNHIKEELE